MSTLGDAIKAEFKRIMSEQKMGVSDAARQLHVTRQAFHRYLAGTAIPRQKTLERAIRLWGFKLEINGMVVDSASLPLKNGNPKLIQKQPLLWESLDSIKQQDLKVRVERDGSVFKLEVKIDIPA